MRERVTFEREIELLRKRPPKFFREYEIKIGDTVSFPSGESLMVIAGPDKKGEEYYDPNKTGNPLLDTSGSNRQKKLSKNFTVDELAKSGSHKFDKARINPKLVECLQTLRDHLGTSIGITSGYRSFKYNWHLYDELIKKNPSQKRITNSQHLSGNAADIIVKGMTGIQIAKAIIDSCGAKISLGLATTFVHMDVRELSNGNEYGAVWKYRKDITGKQVEEIKRYQRAKVGISPVPIPSISVVKPFRVNNLEELRTDWTKDFEKTLPKGGARNVTKQNEFNEIILQAQQEWELLDPFILKSLLAQESNFNPKAWNKLGFAGMAQLGMREARDVGLCTGASKLQTIEHIRGKIEYSEDAFDFINDQRFDPYFAIPAAARLLKRKASSLNKLVFSRYGIPQGDDFHRFILGAYNAGEGTVRKRVRKVFGKQKPAQLRFETLGDNAGWRLYANAIVARARQS
jgi:uncharacterized protein YcbK (DUF882 family)